MTLAYDSKHLPAEESECVRSCRVEEGLGEAYRVEYSQEMGRFGVAERDLQLGEVRLEVLLEGVNSVQVMSVTPATCVRGQEAGGQCHHCCARLQGLKIHSPLARSGKRGHLQPI